MLDQDFFGSSTQQTPSHLQSSTEHAPSNNNDAQFDFGDYNNNNVNAMQAQSGGSNPLINYEYDNQQAALIRQEQQRIQERLREKANREYEQKLKRKKLGQQQLQQFTAKKQRQLVARKQQNLQKQRKIIQNNKKLSQQAGWKKVAFNVALKQAENKSKKDTNRMRQAIINKRNDQTN